MQLVRPETLHLVDPASKLLEWLSSKLQEAGSCIIPEHLFLEKTRHPQDSQMTAHCGPAHIKRIGHLARTQWTPG